MTANDPSRPSREWHDLELRLRSVELEARFLKEVLAGRDGLIQEMHEIHGPTLPPKVKARIEKAMAIDPVRKAETLARLYRAEVRRNLELELQESGDVALRGQIKATIRMYEEMHGLRSELSCQDRVAEDKSICTAAQALALARQVQEAHPTPELEAAIHRWGELVASSGDTARHFARLPLATQHDTDLWFLIAGFPKQREQAVRNLIDRGCIAAGAWFDGSLLGRTRAKHELEGLRHERGQTWVYDWLKNVILPAALVLAADDIKSRERVRIRIGTRWVLDADGSQAFLEPWELSDEDLANWLRACALRRAEEGILADLEQPDDRSLFLEDPLPAKGSSGADEVVEPTRLIDILPNPESGPAERILRREEQLEIRHRLDLVVQHFRSLPQGDQKLLALRAEGRGYEDLAKILGPSPGALRKRVERLKRGFPDPS